MQFQLLVFCILGANLIRSENATYKPVVLWHGMGDSCCFPFSLGRLMKTIRQSMPGVYLYSIQIGDTLVDDVENGYFEPVSEQLEFVCKKIATDPQLKDGFNAIGFSQGGQFLRALTQRCPNPPMHNLISLGGQHQGVYGIPNCGSLDHKTCNYFRKLLNYAAYASWVQNYLVQATYWHDPLNEEKYRKGSIFLADINNEVTINKNYSTNLQKLNKLVLVKFSNDTMVQPVDTEWFGFYKPGQDKDVLKLQETDLYLQDRLGLKQMDADGKLDFMTIVGNHLEFSDEWFIENVIEKYLQ